ncbi:hypothetical protein [Streptomyces sp. CBMA156]|uniref:hypothetical protein n=1 Tax=Streptomyces sp. CBMA156 TaxID=1930280 RepID=UPI001661F100|nr:hypothetical protein [Streptomyces sp. CBMA156]MBD0673475.1 hypothetical protein [Streptomyces sp. CBMA156]
MFRLIRTRTWTETRRRLADTEYELEAATLILDLQNSGWTPPPAPVAGDLAAVLRHVDTGVREEAAVRAADHAEEHLDPTNAIGLAETERWTGYPDGTAVHYLGAGRWLHHHPGHATLHTQRSARAGDDAQTVLVHSGSRLPEQVRSLAALLAMLADGRRVDYRLPHAPRA